jgi:hypothetical protein
VARSPSSLQPIIYLCLGTTDQPAEVHCETCADDYCDVCFASQHRKGSRKKHVAVSLAVGGEMPSKPSPNGVTHHDAVPNGQDVRSSYPFRANLTSGAGGNGRR